jgi:hypothetical protein
VLGVAVEPALVHDHVEVAFEEGGSSGWISCADFASSLAQPVPPIVMVFPVEVMHHHILSIDKLVDKVHEVSNGVSVSFVDLLEELDVGDSLLVVGYDVFVLNTRKSVAILKVAISVLLESFVMSHPHSSETIGVARTIISCLVVGHEEP